MGEPAGDTNASDTVLNSGPMNLNPSRGPVGERMAPSDISGTPAEAPPSVGNPVNLNPQYGPVGREISPAEQDMVNEMRGAGMDPNNIVDRSLARMGAAFGMPADASKASQSAVFGALTGTVLASVAMEQLMDKISKAQTAKAQTARTQQGAVVQQTLASRTVGPMRQSLGASGSSNGVGAA